MLAAILNKKHLQRLWKTQPLIAQMPTIHLDKALESSTLKSFRWKSHNDWVEQMRIDRRLNQIISCSNDEQFAVIIGCILPTTDINIPLQQSSTHNFQENSSNVAGSNQAPGQPGQPTNLEASLNQNLLNQQAGQMSNVNNASQNNATNNQSNQVGRNTPSNMQQQQQTSQQVQSAPNIGSINKGGDVKRRPESNETVFKVNKGVKTFDFSFEKNLLITGG
jgi:hypothetical protein